MKEQRNHPHIFKRHVPEWLKYAGLLLLLIPSILTFASATAGPAQAVGYYGISPADVQFSMLVFYATIVAFTPVARHFFARLYTRTYLWISVIGEVITLYGCYTAKSLEMLVVMRFLTGIFNTGINNVALDLLFRRLKSEHAREIGFAIFYTLVLAASGLTSFTGYFSYDGQSLNHYYKFVMYSFWPGTIILTLIINRHIRLVPFKLIRVERLGWTDYFLIGTSLMCAAYFFAYGQEYNWLDDVRIMRALILFIICAICAFLRLKYVHHPFINLRVFSYPNFRIGIFLLIILYFVRGAFNVTVSYFNNVLSTPFLQASQMLLINIAGSIIGSCVSTFLITRKVHMRRIWFCGFLMLLIFYGTMSFRFNPNLSVYDFIGLLLLQGIGQGMLMNPIIVFYVSAVPSEMSNDAASFGVMARFMSFSGSIALINYFQLKSSQLHQALINNNLNAANKQYTDYIRQQAILLASRGILPDKASGVAASVYHQKLARESYIEFAMNYYQGICVLILIAIFLILCVPAINRTIINLKQNRPFGAGF